MEQDESDEDRLEAALERIAKRIDAPDPVATEVAARLDRIIATLREAVASDRPGPGRPARESAGQTHADPKRPDDNRDDLGLSK